MFDIGFSEMLLLAAIALVAIGPKQLPEVARVVGRMLNEFKRATGDLTRTLGETRDTANTMLRDARRSMDPLEKRDSDQQSGAEVSSQNTHASTQMSFELSNETEAGSQKDPKEPNQ